MSEKSKYRYILKLAHESGKTEEFYTIMDDYFCELEKYHPKTYQSLMNEIQSLGEKINILSEDELSKYLKYMHHKDMPKLWTIEQTSKVAKDIGIDFDEWKYNEYTFNYVMNMMRTDYYSEFKKMFYTSPLMKQTILDSPSFYAHLAKSWLEDEDAPADKALKYISLVTGEDTEGV